MENKLLSMYLKNLNFLEENFQDIFKKIVTLESAIESKQYIERWSLEYKDDKYFDIKNITNGHYFYKIDSFKYSQKLASDTNMDTQDTFSMLYRDDNNKFALSNNYEKVKSIINYINNNIDFEKISFRTINKYIFFGSGLGLHINDIFNKIKPLNTYIIEPDIEIFRLSMFITDYQNFQFDDHTLFLSIGDDDVNRKNELDNFFNYHSYMNSYIKYNTILDSYKYLVDETLNYLSLQPLKQFLINFDFTTMERTIDLYNEDYKFISSKFIDEKFFSDIKNPCLVIAGGPSLDKNLKWIKKNQDKIYIISVNLVTPKLLNYGITPDLVIAIDPNQYVYEIMSKLDPSILKDIKVIAASHIEKRAIDLFSKENCFIMQALPIFTKLGDFIAGDNVGAIALSVSILLKFKTIYTIGNDAAFDNETGRFYASGAYFSDKINGNNMVENENNDNTITCYDILQVKGNLRDKVSTNRKYLAFKDSSERVIELYTIKRKYKSKLYNLSDGAYIQGLEPLNIDNINLSLDNKNNTIMSTLLNQFIEVNFENGFKHDLQLIKFILFKLKASKSKHIYDINSFLELKLDITKTILEILSTADLFIIHFFERLLTIIDNYTNFYLSLDTSENLSNIDIFKDLWIDVFADIFTELEILLSKKLKE